GDSVYYAMQFIQGQGLDLVIDELRRLRGGGTRNPEWRVRSPGDRRPPSDRTHDRPPRTRAAGPASESGQPRSELPGPAPELQARHLSRMAQSLLIGGFELMAPGASSDRSATEVGNDRVDPSATTAEGPPITLARGPTASAVLPGGKVVSTI